MLTIPTLDFAPFIEKHLNHHFRKSSEWANFYAEMANDIYETYDSLSKLKKEVKGATESEKKELSDYMNTLDAQVNQFMDLMSDAEFESHYYDRLWSELCGMSENIDAIKKQLS